MMIISFLREYYGECIIGLIISVFVVLLGEFITNGKLTKSFLIRFFAIITPIVLFAILLNDPNFFPTPTRPVDDSALTENPMPDKITAMVQQVTDTPKPTETLTAALPSSLYQNEIPDSWDEIIAAIDDGTAKQRYAVGAYKPLGLGQYGTVNMQLAGFDLDDRADGKGNAATTWIAKEILPETHRWNPYVDDDKEGTGSIGGWAKCELRRWMNERILPAIPENVRNRLVFVKKSQESYDINWNFIQTTEDKVWIPSYDEVFGDRSLYYGLFRDQYDRRVKTRDGSAAWWWLRSADYFAYGPHYIYSDGIGGNAGANDTSGGVVVCFCL